MECVFLGEAYAEPNGAAPPKKRVRQSYPIALWPQYKLTLPDSGFKDAKWLVLGYNQHWIKELVNAATTSNNKTTASALRKNSRACFKRRWKMRSRHYLGMTGRRKRTAKKKRRQPCQQT